MIYAIRAGSYVKIGYTSDSVESRINAMQTGCPYELTIAAFGPGERSLEWQYHLRLKKSGVHVRGEWFKACKETDWVIDRIRERCEEPKTNEHKWSEHIPSLGDSNKRLGRILQFSNNVASNSPKRRSRTPRATQTLQPDQSPSGDRQIEAA